MPTKYLRSRRPRAALRAHRGDDAAGSAAGAAPRRVPAVRARRGRQRGAVVAAAGALCGGAQPARGRSAGTWALARARRPRSRWLPRRAVVRVLDGIGAPPAVVVGHGFGGTSRSRWRLRRPERVRAVVTIGTAVRSRRRRTRVDQLRQVVHGRIGQQFDTPFFGGAPDFAVMREFWGEMVKTDPQVRLQDVLAYRGVGSRRRGSATCASRCSWFAGRTTRSVRRAAPTSSPPRSRTRASHRRRRRPRRAPREARRGQRGDRRVHGGALNGRRHREAGNRRA